MVCFVSKSNTREPGGSTFAYEALLESGDESTTAMRSLCGRDTVMLPLSAVSPRLVAVTRTVMS